MVYKWLGHQKQMNNRVMVPTSLVTQNSMYFPGYFQVKAMKFHINLTLNHNIYVGNEDMRKMYLKDFFL